MSKDGDLEVSGSADTPMRDVLRLGAPPSVDEMPKSFFLNREREIEIIWDSVLEEAGWEAPAENTHLVEHIMTKHPESFDWAGSQRDAWLIELTEGLPAYTHKDIDVTVFKVLALNEDTGETFFTVEEQRTVPVSATTTAIIEGVIFRVPDEHGGSRFYLPRDAGGAAVLKDKFESDWTAAWKQVFTLELVYHGASAEEDAKKGFTFVEIVRSDEAFLIQRFSELIIEQELAAKYKELASTLTERLKLSSPTEIDYISDQYRELMSFARDVDAKIKALSGAARRMGYYLITEAGKVVPFYDATGTRSDQPLQVGDLYRTHETVRTWNVEHVSSRKNWLGKVRYSHWSSTATKTFDRYVKVEADTAPWEKLLNAYRSQGFETHIFNRDRYGRLTSSAGLPVATIVDELERDESRRRRTVLAFPIMEETVLGDEVIVAYQVFGRPLPDFKRSTLPSLRIREDLSYRFAWQGTTIGELAATIPLSPGEEREVTAVVTTSEENRESYASTSLLDVSREDRSDFESAFEREMKKESESKLSASAEIKGSYGAVGGSAKVSSDKTTKELARTLEKTVKRASTKVNSQQRTEVKVERSSVRTQATSSTVTYKVRNINEAATLNVAFFRLLNRYDSLLCVEDFSLQVESGRSLLAGWDVYDQQRFELEDVDALVEHLSQPGNFPGRNKQWTDIDKQRIANAIALQITKQNQKSLDDPLLSDEDQAELTAKFAISGNDRAQDFAPMEFFSSLDAQDVDKVSSELSNLANLRRETLRMTRKRAQSIKFEDERSSFLLDSGGLYADVIMGVGVGADDYAQARRQLELDRVKAEIGLTQARADWLKARAARA